MPDAFDPYNEWLGIPPEDQPPHHYQLLGIDLFEGDAEKIAHAALSRTETLRTYQLGSHFEASQQLLNQVAQAKLCLLDAEKKAAYDEALKQRLSPAEAPAPTATVLAGIQRPRPTPRPQPTVEQAAVIKARRRAHWRAASKVKSMRQKAKIGLPVAAVVLFFFIIAFFVMTYETPDSKVRSLLARAEVKIQLGDLDEATHLVRKATNIEGANNLNAAKKLLDAIAAQQEAAAQAEAEQKARQIAERKAQEEAERKAQEEAERKAQEEAERKAKEEAERKAKEEAKRKAMIEAQQRAKEEAERRAKAEREAIKEDADRKAMIEAQQKAKEEANRREEAERRAEPTIKFTYWPGGQRKSEAHYKNGKEDGLWTRWHKNGQKQYEGHWKDGKKDGLETWWYGNGRKMSEFHYKNGKKEGLWTWWDKNGNKIAEIQYKDGKRVSH